MKAKILVPESLADIRLSQYQKFHKTTDGIEDAAYIHRQMVGIFCNIPDDLVDKIALKDFNEIVDQITKVLNTKPYLVNITHHKGKDLGFIPNFDEITVAEQSDIDSNIKYVDKWHLVMATLYRPVTLERNGKYLIEEYNPDGKGIDLTLDCVFGAMFFFTNLLTDLLNCTQNFIEAEVSQDPRLQTSGLSGDGIKTYISSLRETFSNLTKLLNYDYMMR